MEKAIQKISELISSNLSPSTQYSLNITSTSISLKVTVGEDIGNSLYFLQEKLITLLTHLKFEGYCKKKGITLVNNTILLYLTF